MDSVSGAGAPSQTGDEMAAMAMHTADDSRKGGNGEPELSNVFAKAIHYTQQGLIGVLFLMSKDSRRSLFVGVIAMAIDAAQVAALATPVSISKSLQYNESTEFVFRFFNVFVFHNWAFWSKYSALKVLTAVSVVAILCINVSYVGYSWVQHNFQHIWTVRVLRAIADIVSGIAYIPIVSIFASSLGCNGISQETCYIVRPIVSILLLFLVPFSLAVTATFYDARPDSGNVLRARAHSRVAVLRQLVRTVLALLSGILPSFVQGSNDTAYVMSVIRVWSIILTVSTGIVLFAYVWLQPNYSSRVNTFRALFTGVAFWASICFVMSGIRSNYDPNDDAVEVLFFGGLILLLPLIHLGVLWRQQRLISNIKSKSYNTTFAVFEVELKVRLLLKDAIRSRPTRDVATTFELHARRNSTFKVDSLAHGSVLAQAAAMFADAVEHNTESSLLCLMHAEFLLFMMNKPWLARRALLLAEARKPALDEKFIIFKLKKHLEEDTFRSDDIMAFVAGEKHLKLSKAYDRQCNVLLLRFWKTLLGTQPEMMTRIRKLADDIAEATTNAQNSYDKLLKLKPDDAEVLERYSGFVGVIGNDQEQEKKLRRRAMYLREQKAKRKNSVFSSRKNDSGLLDANSAILTVDASGTKSTGQLITVNNAAAQFFNQPSDMLLGQNIGKLLLPPFSHEFAEITRRFLEQGDDWLFEEVFPTYVNMNRESVILPCSLVMKPFTTDGIKFNICVCINEGSGPALTPEAEELAAAFSQERGANYTAGPQCALVDPTSKRCIGMSRGLHDYLKRQQVSLTSTNMTNAAVTSDNLRIDEILANYSETYDRCSKSGGGSFQLITSGYQPDHDSGFEDDDPDVEPVLYIESIRLHGSKGTVLHRLLFFGVNRTLSKPLVDDDMMDDVEYPDAPNSDNMSLIGSDNVSDEFASDNNDEDAGRSVTASSYGFHSPQLVNGHTAAMDTNAEDYDGYDIEDHQDDIGINDEAASPGSSVRGGGSVKDNNSKVRFAREPGLKRKKIKNAGSKYSGKAASSCASTSNNMSVAVIRRAMMSRRNELVPYLAKFRRLYLCTMIVLVVLVVAVYSVRLGQLATYKSNNESIDQAGLRRYSAVTISYMTHALVMMNLGADMPAGITESVARAQILGAANKLEEVDQFFFSERAGLEAELKSYYTSRIVTIRSIEKGVERTTKHTLYDASSGYAGQAKQAASTPLSELTYDSPLVYSLVNNIRPLPDLSSSHQDSGLLMGLNETTRLFAAMSDTAITSMNEVVSSVLAAFVLVGMAVLLFFVVVPMLNRIEENKRSVFRALLDMPSDVLEKIGDRYAERLRSVHDVDPHLEDNENWDNVDGTATATATATADAGDGADKAAADDDEKTGILKAVARNKRLRHSNLLNHEQLLNANQSDKWWILVKLSLVLVVSMTYFGVTMSKSFEMADHVKDAPSEANMSGRRRVETRYAFHALRMYMTGGTKYGGFNVSADEVESTISRVENLHNALVFGNPEYRLEGFMNHWYTDQKQKQLYFHNGCQGWKYKWQTNVLPCNEFSEGLVKQGLHHAFMYFFRSMRNMADHIANLNAANPESTFATIGAVNETLNGIPEYEHLVKLEEFYMTPQIALAIRNYSMYTKGVVAADEVLGVWALVCFLLLIVLSYAFLTRRLITNINNEVKRTRSLLLTIPEDIINTIGSIRKLLRNEYKRGNRQ